MAWNSISLPIYDRGFDWMVILYKLEYLLIRLPQDPNSPPRIVTSVMTLSVMDFWSGKRGAALSITQLPKSYS